MKHLIVTVLLAAGAMNASAQEYFEKTVVFPAGADSLTKIEMAARVVPTPLQRAWQDRELTAFLHFGMNTFTDREWGDGKESPTLFNPDGLDTDQWVKTLKDAGFKMVILTAKHHDGFCLWPTKTTAHSVANSPWRDGKGDVVADLRRSCDKYGMKLGIYLSPWDRNAPVYGDSPKYNDLFVAQLTELLSNYGKIDEVWFDGACGEGPNGKKQEYDWIRYRETMKRLQPEAVLAITGDDVRWVGNEGGVGRETEWSVTPLVPNIFKNAKEVNAKLGINEMSAGIGSRELIARADSVRWWPSEVDVSIRPGWFYHASEEPHSLLRLANIYLSSVGRNAVLLLNIPPDNHGQISSSDVNRLMELRRWIDANFSDNRLQAASGRPGRVNCIVAEEDISKGQRVEAFDVEALVDGQWQTVTSGTTIGKKRILTFPEVDAEAMRLTVRQSRLEPFATLAGAYLIEMPAEGSASASALTPIDNADTRLLADQIFVSLPEATEIAGFEYTPAAGQAPIFKYAAMASNDGIHWQLIPTYGEFSNIAANPIAQKVRFASPVKARYFSLVCYSNTLGAPAASGSLTLLHP